MTKKEKAELEKSKWEIIDVLVDNMFVQKFGFWSLPMVAKDKKREN